MRLIRFIKRLKRNYRVHGRWFSIHGIIRMSWLQSREKKICLWFPTEVIDLRKENK
jgi:hypothetical protein